MGSLYPRGFVRQMFEDLTAWQKLLAAIAGIGASVAAIYKLLYNPVTAVGRGIRRLFSFPSMLEETRDGVRGLTKKTTDLETRQKCIEKELTNNGGSSIKDMIQHLMNHTHMNDQQLDLIHSISDIPTFRINSELECVSINKAYSRTIGLSLEDTKHKNWVSYIHPDDQEQVTRLWDAATKDKREFIARWRFRRPGEGSDIWHKCECTAYPLIAPGGILMGYRGFCVVDEHDAR